QYDDPPPDHLDDLPALLAAGRVRLANQLRAFIEVSDGVIVASDQSGQGHVGAARQAADAAQVGFAAVALAALRAEPEPGEAGCWRGAGPTGAARPGRPAWPTRPHGPLWP